MRINDDDTRRGIEARYWQDGDVHCVYVQPTNHRADWVSNVLGAWPRKEGYHRAWRKDALWLVRWIVENVSERDVWVGGISRGGAIALIAGDFLIARGYNVHVDSSGAPSPGRLRNDIPGTDTRARGDVVPFLPVLYRRPRRERELVGRWTPLFWRAHMSYRSPR